MTEPSTETRLTLATDAVLPVDQIVAAVDAGQTTWEYSTMPAANGNIGIVARQMRIRRGNAIDIGTLIGKVISVQHLIIHAAGKADENGEVHLFPRTLLIDHDDSVVVTGAVSILQSLNEFCSASGRKLPFDPPQKFIVNQKPTTPPRRVYWLEPVDDPAWTDKTTSNV